MPGSALPPIIEEAEIMPRSGLTCSPSPSPDPSSAGGSRQRDGNNKSRGRGNKTSSRRSTRMLWSHIESMPTSSHCVLLSFLPSRQVILLSVVCHWFHGMVNSFTVFAEYTLKISSGKRHGFLSRKSRQQATGGDKSVQIDDKNRTVQITSHSRSPRSEHTHTHILNRLSKSGVNRIDFVRVHESAVGKYLMNLGTCPIEIVTIGEQCQSWNWNTIVSIFEAFPRVTDMEICIAGFESSLPTVKKESDWISFLQSVEPYIMNLQRLSCVDDALLRVILELCANRNDYVASYAQRKEGVMSRKKQLHRTHRRRDSQYARGVSRGGISFDSTTQPSLTYVSYGCQFLPTTPLTGTEFRGVKLLELTPYDDMVIHIPKCVVSLRISRKEFSESGTWRINVDVENNLRELCLYEVRDLGGFKGMGNLTSLQYLCIGCMPESRDDVVSAISTLRVKSPLYHVSFCFACDDRFLDNIGRILHGKSSVALHRRYVKPPFVDDRDISFSFFSPLREFPQNMSSLLVRQDSMETPSASASRATRHVRKASNPSPNPKRTVRWENGGSTTPVSPGLRGASNIGVSNHSFYGSIGRSASSATWKAPNRSGLRRGSSFFDASTTTDARGSVTIPHIDIDTRMFRSSSVSSTSSGEASPIWISMS